MEGVASTSPIEKQFITDLSYSIEKDSAKRERKPSKAFKPSSIGGCPRNLYYQLTGAEMSPEQRNSAVGTGILESGTDRHERLQKAIDGMKENGIDCEYVDVAEYIETHNLTHLQIVEKKGMETKCFWAELPLSFLTDGIIKYKGEYYILEIKTMGSKKFFSSSSVREEHKDQGVCYSLAFHIDKVLYLYEDRDTLCKKAFLMEVSEQMKSALLDKTDMVKKYVALGEPPEVLKANCAYCAYKQKCKEDG